MGDSLAEAINKFKGIKEIDKQKRIIDLFSKAFNREEDYTVEDFMDDVNKKYSELRWNITIPQNKSFNINYGKEEKALDYLFKELPSNAAYNDVLIKVIMLNNLYSTQLNIHKSGDTISVKDMARRIVDIDNEKTILSFKPKDAVERIGGNEYYKGFKKAYSFASKYLSFTHRNTGKGEDVVPITDSYSRRTIKLLKYENEKIDLDCYQIYYDAISKLKDEYNVGFKEIDAFLWIMGKAFS